MPFCAVVGVGSAAEIKDDSEDDEDETAASGVGEWFSACSNEIERTLLLVLRGWTESRRPSSERYTTLSAPAVTRNAKIKN